MNCIFVHPEFAALVDAYCEANYPHLRLGARAVEIGKHTGKGFVPVDIIGCTPEWTAIFSAFVIGQPTLEPGSTVTIRDAYGKEWPHEVYDIKDPQTLFNKAAL